MQKQAILCALLAPLMMGSCQKREAASHDQAGGPNKTAPSSPPQSAEEMKAPLAKIDDVTITLGEFEERINRQSPYTRARYTSLEQKKEFLDSLVRFEILAKEAYKRGLDKDPEVVRTMKQVMIQKLIRDEFDAKVTADSVKDADMQAYYQANLADYVKPEEVRASAIILRNKAQADRVLLEAKGDAGKTNKGFRDLGRGDQAPRRRPPVLRPREQGAPGGGREGVVRAREYRRRLRRRRCGHRCVLHRQTDRPPQIADQVVRRSQAADPQQALPRAAAGRAERLRGEAARAGQDRDQRSEPREGQDRYVAGGR
jgi:hypothetical protein